MNEIIKAPENFLTPDDVKAVSLAGNRRQAIKAIFASAIAGTSLLKAASASEYINTEPLSLGYPVAAKPYGMPSPFESNLQRRQSPGLTQTNEASVSFAPLQSLFGIITPSGLHFERHHSGYRDDIDPSQHRLMINGSDDKIVKKPMIFSMADIMRLPSVSRMHFIECGANSAMNWGNVAVPTVQYSHGMLSCSEYTGVPLKILLDMAGADYKRGRYVLAEGNDANHTSRTLPMELIEDGEVLVAYGQNGEMLRPENGYPLRLVVPGVQGVSWVKYLRRLEVGDKPYAQRDEAIHYIDMLPDGIHRQYTTIQECKSVITSPSGGQKLTSTGFYNLTGLSWSGRGKIKQVDISLDGGKNWSAATLQTPILSKCLTRFTFPLEWTGGEMIIQSRAIDETGYVQPSPRQLRAARGTRSIYHNNMIQSWLIKANGEVHNVQVS